MSYRILIVDDSMITRSILKKTLKLAQIPTQKIYEAGSGKEGLDILLSNEIDLVFADINMPVMKGNEMIEVMSQTEKLKNIPVIIISTEGSTDRIKQLTDKGVKAYIQKPFVPEMIVTTINQVMEK